MSIERSGAVAGVTNEAKGCPSATVAMVAARLARSNLMAAHAASTFTLSATEFTPLRHNLALGEAIEAKVKP